jgi:CTP:molybdopterin cytidylyltransferase MocA
MRSAQARHPDRILRATGSDGRPGQPVLFPPRLVPRFADLSGDEGARRLLPGEPLVPVLLPGTRALTDLDTPEDWAVWRLMRESPGPR